MEKENTGGARKSSVEFDFLEDWVREKVQEYIQFLLGCLSLKSVVWS